MEGDDTKPGILVEIMRNHLRDMMKEDPELRILVSMAWKDDSGHFIYYIIKFFSLCVGNVGYEFVKDELINIAINYTLLEKVLAIFIAKLKSMQMTEQYIEKFK